MRFVDIESVEQARRRAQVVRTIHRWQRKKVRIDKTSSGTSPLQSDGHSLLFVSACRTKRYALEFWDRYL